MQADRELQQYKRDVQGRMLVESMRSSEEEGSLRKGSLDQRWSRQGAQPLLQALLDIAQRCLDESADTFTSSIQACLRHSRVAALLEELCPLSMSRKDSPWLLCIDTCESTAWSSAVTDQVPLGCQHSGACAPSSASSMLTIPREQAAETHSCCCLQEIVDQVEAMRRGNAGHPHKALIVRLLFILTRCSRLLVMGAICNLPHPEAVCQHRLQSGPGCSAANAHAVWLCRASGRAPRHANKPQTVLS